MILPQETPPVAPPVAPPLFQPGVPAQSAPPQSAPPQFAAPAAPSAPVAPAQPTAPAAPPAEAAPPPATPTPPNYQIPPPFRPPAADATPAARTQDAPVDPEPIPTAGSADIPDWANMPGLTLPPDLSSIAGFSDNPGLRQPNFDDPPPVAPGPPSLLRPVFDEPPPPAQLGADVPGVPTSRRESRAQSAPEPASAPRVPSQPSAPYAPPPSGALYSAPPPPGVNYTLPAGVALPPSSLPPAAPRVLPGESRLIPSRLVEQSRQQPAIRVPQPGETVPVPRAPIAVQAAAEPQTTGTLGAWVMAILPLLQFAVVYAIFGAMNQSLLPGSQWGILAIPALFSLLFAAADRRRLLDRGFPQAPNAVLGILAPVYLVARCVVIGPRAIAPLLVWLALQAAAVVGVMILLPTVLAAAIASST